MKKIKIVLAALVGASFLCLGSSCGDDNPVNPPVTPQPVITANKVFMKTSGKYQIGDTVWIKCVAPVTAANAKVSFMFNRTDDGAAKLWEELPIHKTEGESIQVYLPNWTATNINMGYSKAKLMNKTNEASFVLFDSLNLSPYKIVSPKAGDTLKLNSTVSIKWLLNDVDILGISQTQVRVYDLDNDIELDLLTARGKALADTTLTWSWTIGHEPDLNTIDYSVPRKIAITVGDYNLTYTDQIIVNTKP